MGNKISQTNQSNQFEQWEQSEKLDELDDFDLHRLTFNLDENIRYFYFHGHLDYNICFYCRKIKYTDEQIKLLQNPNLTEAEYKKHFGGKPLHYDTACSGKCALEMQKISPSKCKRIFYEDRKSVV